MGKHSNIIFCDEDGTIIDSIKHVSSAVSSLREVLPGRPYFIPATQEDKFNAMTMDATQICDAIKAKPMSICKAIYTTFTGVSPLVASELAYRAGMDADQSLLACTDDEIHHLSNHIAWFFDEIRHNEFHPVFYLQMDDALHMGLGNAYDPPVCDMFAQNHTKCRCLQGTCLVGVRQI